MATGSSRSLEGGQDAVYDYCCTPCTNDNLNAEASFYCRNCSNLFCDACVRFHDKIHKDHQVLGRTEVARWGKVKAVTHSLMCEEHSDKEEEMYCGDHDLTCCHICINIYHRACNEVSHVSEVAEGLQKMPEFKSFLTNVARTQTRLRNLLDKRSKNTKLLQKARNEITSSFKDIRKNINQFVDDVEKESMTEMDRLLSILQRKVQLDTDTCLDFDILIKKYLDDMKKFGNQCNDFAFQCFKRCAKQMTSAEEMMSSMGDEDFQLKFTPDASIQQFQSSLRTFGKFDITPVKLTPDYVYIVDKIEKYTVRTKTDTTKCTVSGISQLPDGQTAIVDNKNKKMKLLSSSKYSVTSEHDLPPYPNDICTTAATGLVVTVHSASDNKLTKNELHFINATGGQLSHTTQLDHVCSSIACHSSQLYVGSRKAVYEYNLSGIKLRKIYEDTSHQGITVHTIAVSDDGNRIYITNYVQSCLVTIDKSGHQLSVLSDPELQGPSGVCMADNGTVFVCGQDSHTVIQVDSEGKKKMVTLAKQSDGVNFPSTLSYDRNLKLLLLGQYKSDNLTVLKLK